MLQPSPHAFHLSTPSLTACHFISKKADQIQGEDTTVLVPIGHFSRDLPTLPYPDSMSSSSQAKYCLQSPQI